MRRVFYLIVIGLLVGLWTMPARAQNSVNPSNSLSISNDVNLTFSKNPNVSSAYSGNIPFNITIDPSIKNICNVYIKNNAKIKEQRLYQTQPGCSATTSDIFPKKITFTKLAIGQNNFDAIVEFKDVSGKKVTKTVGNVELTLTTDPSDTTKATAVVSSVTTTGLGGSDRTKLGDLGDKDKQLTARLREDDTIKNLWKVMLRLADTFVALFFLLVAFATILHINYDTYGVKKAIMPLFLGIILAHFSLVIIQYFADFAQSLTAGFLNGAAAKAQNIKGCLDTSIESRFACNLAATMFRGGLAGINNTIALGGGIVGGIILLVPVLLATPAGPGVLGFAWLALFVIAIVAILLPTFLIIAMAFLLYIRSYIIIFLAIISPIAWLTIMWTPVQGFFKKWWSQFTVWIFMAPICLFFVWLAIEFYNQTDPGDANFGTYLLTLVMLYLAISAPFKMGGAIMAAWGGFGKNMATKAGGYAKGLSNTALDRWGASSVPWNRNKTWTQFAGISGLDTGMERMKHTLEERNAYYKTIAGTGALPEAANVGWGTSVLQGPLSFYNMIKKKNIKRDLIEKYKKDPSDGGEMVMEEDMDRRAEVEAEASLEKEGLFTAATGRSKLYSRTQSEANKLLNDEVGKATNNSNEQMIRDAGDANRTKAWANVMGLAKVNASEDEVNAAKARYFSIHSQKDDLQNNWNSLLNRQQEKSNPVASTDATAVKTAVAKLTSRELGGLHPKTYDGMLIDGDKNEKVVELLKRIVAGLGSSNEYSEGGITYQKSDEGKIDQELKRLEGIKGETLTIKTSVQLPDTEAFRGMGLSANQQAFIQSVNEDLVKRARESEHATGTFHNFASAYETGKPTI